jgi:hypothetical protein
MRALAQYVRPAPPFVVTNGWPRVRPVKKPIPYKHPGGGSWVKLSGKNVREFKRLY